jgi:hypothetical protein
VGPHGIAGPAQATALLDQPLEALRVELVGCDVEQVAAPVVADALRVAERLAQLGHVDLNAARGAGPAFSSPDVLDQPLGRDHLTAPDDQRREQRALLVASQRTRLTVQPHLQRSQDPDVERHLTAILSDP